MKQKVFISILFIILSSSLFAVFSQNSSTFLNFLQRDFGEPEQAINFFVQSIAKNNLEDAFSAFSINQSADLYNTAAQANFRGSIFVLDLAVPKYPMYAQLNRAGLTGSYSKQIQTFCYSFLSSEEVTYRSGRTTSDARISTFVKSVDPRKLKNLKVVKIEPIFLVASAKDLQQQAIGLGANSIAERVVLYELNGLYYVGTFRLLKYGKSWRISSLRADIFSLMIENNGGVLKTTPQKFEKIARELK